jgi:hypothetical protein
MFKLPIIQFQRGNNTLTITFHDSFKYVATGQMQKCLEELTSSVHTAHFNVTWHWIPYTLHEIKTTFWKQTNIFHYFNLVQLSLTRHVPKKVKYYCLYSALLTLQLKECIRSHYARSNILTFVYMLLRLHIITLTELSSLGFKSWSTLRVLGLAIVSTTAKLCIDL